MSAAPYRSRSVVNLHHQDTETDEATMVLPPEDYCDTPQRSIIKNNMSSTTHITTNNNHQHSPTPSAASSLSSEHNTVSRRAAIFVHLCGILLFHLEGVPGGQCVSMPVRLKSLPFKKHDCSESFDLPVPNSPQYVDGGSGDIL